jgi:hypothetical protein
MSARSYWPGDAIPDSGVYRVVHTTNHAVAHDVIILAEGAFPPCRHCGTRVYFTLAKAGEDIARNLHFSAEASVSGKAV